MDFDTPLKANADVPAGVYAFKVVNWHPCKEAKPIGPERSLCLSIEYTLALSNGVDENGEKIDFDGEAKDVFKLVLKLQFMLFQYFGSIGDRKHGSDEFKPNYTKEHNLGAEGRVRVSYREGREPGKKFRSLTFLDREDDTGV